ncbi:MAG: GumC family protein [Caulobacteraceae bacterium]
MQNAWAWRSEQPQVVASSEPPPAVYTPHDLAAMLWRERFLMLGVFLAIAALGVLAALQMKTAFQAHSSLLIRLSPEYVYNPRVGDAARGLAPEPDQVIQSETEILGSTALKARVLHDIGLPRMFPKLARAYQAASPARRQVIEAMALHTMDTSLKIASAPDTSVVRLTYTDPDAQISALTLNTLVDEYLRYRINVLMSHDATVVGGQRRIFEQRLDAADQAYARFLSDNGISDFDNEKAALGQIYAQLLTDSYNVTAQLAEAEGRLGATSQEMGHSPAEIGLYRDVDHAAADKLITLRLGRQDLLSRYKPDAQPVKDLDRQIGELEALDASGQVAGPGARRVGVNPVFQTLQTEHNQLSAEAASLRSRKGALTSELAQVNARRQKLTELQPQYDDLVRERDALAVNVKNFTQREQEDQAQQSITQQQGDGNVRVVQRAITPSVGASLKKPVLLLALAFGVFAALCTGLLAAFMRRGVPTPAFAERALGLPVLAAPERKAAYA